MLDEPLSVADCAEAGLRDRGCKQRIAGRGWVAEDQGENRFAVSVRVAGAIWREITTVAAMGREEKDRRRAIRAKVGVRNAKGVCESTVCFRGGGRGKGGMT